jgi:hypothetical protein
MHASAAGLTYRGSSLRGIDFSTRYGRGSCDSTVDGRTTHLLRQSLTSASPARVCSTASQEERREAIDGAVKAAAAAKQALLDAGFECPVVTGAGTGTFTLEVS